MTSTIMIQRNFFSYILVKDRANSEQKKIERMFKNALN